MAPRNPPRNHHLTRVENNARGPLQGRPNATELLQVDLISAVSAPERLHPAVSDDHYGLPE
jgi:hypothetical protein